MPVAFHPPLEHPIDAPQAARANDDTANGDLFAAMLANAGKAPPAAVTGSAAATRGASAADSADRDSASRKDGGDAAFDPLAAFAAWTNVLPTANGPAAGRAATDAADPGSTTRVTRRPAGSDMPAEGIAAIAANAAVPNASPAGAADVDADRIDTRAAPARRLAAPPVRSQSAADAKTAGDDAPATHGASAANPAASAVAAAAALLAKAVDGKSAASVDLAAAGHHELADAAPGVNLGATATAAPSAAATLMRQIADPVGSPGFATQVAGEIGQLIHVNADRAQLHVHPADMGPIEVTMRVQHDQVTVTMVAADPQTRAALEQSLPQLRDLLANQGLALANASVNDHPPRNDHRSAGARGGGTASAGVAAIAAIDAAMPVQPMSSMALRLVDLYA